MMGAILISLIAIVFISNEIQLELYFKKREIAYLQIFGMKKKIIKTMLVMDRTLKILFSSCVAVAIYFITVLILNILFEINGIISLPVILVVLLIVLLYSLICTLIPVNKFMKKDIIELLK